MPPFNTHIKTHDGHSMGAYHAAPKNPDAPALIVIQEIFGVNAGMRQMCDAWAHTGYHAVCPDIFWRQQVGVELTDKTPEEWGAAMGYFKGFDTDLGMKDLQSTLNHARAINGANGKVGSIGFCLGGKLAFLMATQSDADCNISYYGVGLGDMMGDVANIKKPLLMHFAQNDTYMDAATLQNVTHALSHNKNAHTYIYAGVEHAFARVNGVHYDVAAASLAQQRSMDFLKTHLG
jgi:carboxymethylenebutenolidase